MWTLCWWAYGQRVKLQFSSSVLRLPAVIFITHFICYCFVYFTRGVQLRGGVMRNLGEFRWDLVGEF